jgi:hypothetical protein
MLKIDWRIGSFALGEDDDGDANDEEFVPYDIGKSKPSKTRKRKRTNSDAVQNPRPPTRQKLDEDSEQPEIESVNELLKVAIFSQIQFNVT